MPESPDPQWFIRVAGAAAALDVLPRSQPVTTARTLAALAAHSPPLFGILQRSDGSRCIAMSALAGRVSQQLPTLPRKRLDEVASLTRNRLRDWPPAHRQVHDAVYKKAHPLTLQPMTA